MTIMVRNARRIDARKPDRSGLHDRGRSALRNSAA
jgi:hypothetical protein